MRKRKLTQKQKLFIKHYTNEKDLETFGNAKQSAIKSYDTSEASAGQIGHNLLKKVEVIQAIEKKALKKEDIQDKLTSVQEKLDSFLQRTDVSPEIASILKENREYLLAHAKLNGDLIDRVQTLNMTVDLNDEEVKNRLSELLNR